MNIYTIFKQTMTISTFIIISTFMALQVTGLKLKSSSGEFLVVGGEIRHVSEILMLLSTVSCAVV